MTSADWIWIRDDNYSNINKSIDWQEIYSHCLIGDESFLEKILLFTVNGFYSIIYLALLFQVVRYIAFLLAGSAYAFICFCRILLNSVPISMVRGVRSLTVANVSATSISQTFAIYLNSFVYNLAIGAIGFPHEPI